MARLTRRKFLQLGVTGASGAMLGLGAGCTNKKKKIPPQPAADKSAYRIRSRVSFCGGCPAACGITGFTRKGKLLTIEGLPDHPDSRGKICARGVAGINLLYHPERILAPKKRVGPRGQGDWKNISWDEAFKILAEAWEKTVGGAPENRAIIQSRNLDDDGALANFIANINSDRLLVFAGHRLPLHQQLADLRAVGRAGMVPDLAHCRYLLNFGANFFEDHPRFVAFNQRFAQARVELATKLVTVSSFLHQTAGRSDNWIAVTPATEGLVARAVGAIMLKEGWADSRAASLQEHFAGVDISRIAWECNLPEAELYRLTREFAAAPQAVAISGRELGEHLGGQAALDNVFLLNVLKGNLETPGGLVWIANEDSEISVPAEGLAQAKSVLWEEQVAGLPAALARGEIKCGFYLLYNSNPVYELPDPAATQKILADEQLVPFLAAADSLPSETAALADLVLPATTYLEEWGLCERESLDRRSFVALRQPLVEKVGQTKSLAEMLNYLLVYNHPERTLTLELENPKATIQKRCAEHPAVRAAGGLAALQKRGFILVSETPRPLSPSAFNRLSNFARPLFAREGLAASEVYLYSCPVNVHSSRTAGLKWLAEIAHKNPLMIHPGTAAVLKIKTGDRVRLSSPVGELITEVILLEGIHPLLTILGRDFGHTAYGKLAHAKPFRSGDRDTHLVWWEKEGHGTAPMMVTPNRIDPATLSAAWFTKVKITKV